MNCNSFNVHVSIVRQNLFLITCFCEYNTMRLILYSMLRNRGETYSLVLWFVLSLTHFQPHSAVGCTDAFRKVKVFRMFLDEVLLENK